MTHTAYISLGSNLGDRLANCELAVQKIRECSHVDVQRQSSWIETDPVGYLDQNKFINGVLEIKTSLAPLALLEALQTIEKLMGRKKTFKWGPRIIDLDILLFDDISIMSENLIIPHAHLQKRDFIKTALLEVNPSLKSLF